MDQPAPASPSSPSKGGKELSSLVASFSALRSPSKSTSAPPESPESPGASCATVDSSGGSPGFAASSAGASKPSETSKLYALCEHLTGPQLLEAAAALVEAASKEGASELEEAYARVVCRLLSAGQYALLEHPLLVGLEVATGQPLACLIAAALGFCRVAPAPFAASCSGALASLALHPSKLAKITDTPTLRRLAARLASEGALEGATQVLEHASIHAHPGESPALASAAFRLALRSGGPPRLSASLRRVLCGVSSRFPATAERPIPDVTALTNAVMTCIPPTCPGAKRAAAGALRSLHSACVSESARLRAVLLDRLGDASNAARSEAAASAGGGPPPPVAACVAALLPRLVAAREAAAAGRRVPQFATAVQGIFARLTAAGRGATCDELARRLG